MVATSPISWRRSFLLVVRRTKFNRGIAVNDLPYQPDRFGNLFLTVDACKLIDFSTIVAVNSVRVIDYPVRGSQLIFWGGARHIRVVIGLFTHDSPSVTPAFRVITLALLEAVRRLRKEGRKMRAVQDPLPRIIMKTPRNRRGDTVMNFVNEEFRQIAELAHKMLIEADQLITVF